jgi:ribonucrease Y
MTIILELLLLSIGFLLGGAFVFLYFFLKKKKLYQTKITTQIMLKRTREEIERGRREAVLDLKNELYKKRSEFELEMKKNRIDLQRLQNKYQKKEDLLEQREISLDDLRKELQQKERDMSRRLDILTSNESKIKNLYSELVSKLEKLSGMKQDEAKRILFESLQKEVKLVNQKWVSKAESETRELAKQKSVDILASSMQRYLTEQVTLHSSSVIHLPNEEMKGRIIGKEGRNIKALELATGMEFVIGDTPEIITISGFNPIRREIAKRSLNKLMQDGRINPTRIEEIVAKCEEELESTIEEIGQQTIMEFGLRSVNPEIARLLGKLHFRTSFTQNQLLHSKEVAYFSRIIASELKKDPEIAARAGLFHDIGKAVSAEVDGPHAVVGGDLAKEYGESDIVINAIASHHEDVSSQSIYGIIVHIADAISASRPGARKETLSTYIKRLEQLEEISNNFEGVKKAYALQAGREIRVIVDEDSVDDDKAEMLARDLAKRIEEEISFPGEIKVNVIREKRFIQAAR